MSVQILLCFTSILLLEIGEGILYTSSAENMKRKENLREILIVINNCLSPIGMGLNLFLRSTIECQRNISVLESQFCNTAYNSQTIPIDCFVSLIAFTVFNQIIFPTKFEYTMLISLIGFIFIIGSIYVSYLHHQSDYSSSTTALNCILCMSYVLMIICQIWIQNSKVQQFALQDGLDTMTALHRRRREVALAINNDYRGIEVDDQTLNSELYFHNIFPTSKAYAHRDNDSIVSDLSAD